MKILETKSKINAFLRKLQQRAGSVSPTIIQSTQDILSDVQKRGDTALRQYTKRFDGHETLVLSPAVIEEYAARAERKTVSALKTCARRIRDFHKLQLEKSWSVQKDGVTLGQVIRPLERVGVYVPGGKAAYPSTVLMNVIPAQVAGVKSIAVTVPTPKGEINPTVMAALKLVGLEGIDVYSVGGAQAVGALAYGTKTIARVRKIVGPGNIFVATAKRLVFGTVDIDMIAGPSEILVIADKDARADFTAADLLSQAEHDELASAVLVTDSRDFALRVSEEVQRQLQQLDRSAIARDSIKKYGAIIVVGNMKEAAALANEIAPEHLEIMTRSPRQVLKDINHAGAVFLGPWSPEPIGDYVAGPNHTLPTGATAAWASPLGTYDFLTRASLIEMTRKGFEALAPTAQIVAAKEGLDAHARSLSVRQKG